VIETLAGSAELTRDAPEYARLFLPVAVRMLVAVGAIDDAEEMIARAGSSGSRRLQLAFETAKAIVAEARGELEDAEARYGSLGERWTAYGFGLEEARARQSRGRVLLALGREEEARGELERARELIEPLGAAPLLADIDALLERAYASTA
jgi:tetratricopeptide (TPR) repeat protein